MKLTKLLAILFLVLISSSIFAQKVHYKDSYYTIVKSKIFHRGHDVFGRLTVGKKDTIYMIAKELYDKKGRLKEQYKNTKKRDRYKLPADFWERKEGVIAKAVTNEKDSNKAIAEINTTEEKQPESAESNEQKTEKVVVNQHIETEKAQKVTAAAVAIEDKKKESNIKGNASEKSEEAKEVKEKPIKETSEKATKEGNIQAKDTNKSEIEKKEKQKRVEEEGGKQQKEAYSLAKEKDKTERVKEERQQKEEKEQEKEAKHQKSKYEKPVAKEKRTDKKSTEKIEKKKKSLEKTENTQLKKQKLLENKVAALISAGAVTSSISNKETFGTIYIKINKEKTYTNKNGDLLLFFDVINNSNKDLVILKPNNSIDSRLDFFSNTMECKDIPITSTDYIAKDLIIKDDDYLTIPANAKIELFINGKYRSWLACNSEDIILQIKYNPFESAEKDIEFVPNMKKQLSKSLKKITPIKIESENIKFKLNKQE